jgi:hypothetical protein
MGSREGLALSASVVEHVIAGMVTVGGFGRLYYSIRGESPRRAA